MEILEPNPVVSPLSHLGYDFTVADSDLRNAPTISESIQNLTVTLISMKSKLGYSSFLRALS